MNIYYPSLGVSVKTPSHKYGGKLEGLCGDCNRDPLNDITLADGTLATNEDDLATSWLFDLPGQDKESCKNIPAKKCQVLPVENDPCVQLLDSNRYGQVR